MNQETYQIILHSQLGSRPGVLVLPSGGADGPAYFSVLGFENQLDAWQSAPGQWSLRGRLASVVGDISFEAQFSPENGRFACTAHTSKGTIPMTGERSGG